MRDPVHEPAPAHGLNLLPAAASAPAPAPERRCILTGAHGPRAALIRLVEGPDAMLWPDLSAKLPGRGAWISPDRALLEEAMARGRLASALRRSFRAPAPAIPPDLAGRIAAGLEARALDRLGLEHRAGRLMFGSEKLMAAARAGRLGLLLHAADAAADGVSRLDQAVRSGGAACEVLLVPVGRERLSKALGRDNSVHIGIADPRAAARIRGDLSRWISFTRPDRSRNPESGVRPAMGEDEGQE